MDIEKELLEGLERVGEIEREILSKRVKIDEYAQKLKEDIESLIEQQKEKANSKDYRVTLISKFCALSELYSVTDFDKMIETREEFVEIFPDHFTSYLNYLGSATISSSLLYGCLGCSFYKGECEKHLAPPGTGQGERCPARTSYST